MTKNTNDPVVFVRDMADKAVKADQTAAEAIGPVMQAVLRLLGDPERLSVEVVPMLEWATELDGPKMKAVTARILLLSDCDKEAIKEAVKSAPNTAKGAETRAMLESRARKITKAIQLIGANAILADKHESSENGRTSFFTDKGHFRIPLQWFVPDNYVYAGLPTASVTFMYGNATPMKLTAYKASDMGTDNEGTLYELPYKPNMDGFIALAYNKVKRQARPEGNKTESEASEDGDAKPVTPATARDCLAKEASRDDYKAAPTGVIKEDWQDFFDNVATNPHYRAMMVRAIARANKAEGEAAASKAA